jgi:hypothetical protein
MTLDQETISYIIGITVLANVGLTIYNSIKKPQQKGEVTDAIFEQKISTLRDTVVNLRDNHLHTIESKLDLHIDNQNKSELTMAKTIGRIETILEERLPRK